MESGSTYSDFEHSTSFNEVLKEFFDIEAGEPFRLGKFETCGWIGQGGQSTIFKAIDPDLHREVAIKVYHGAIDEQQRVRLLSEGRALAQIDSPYVAQCHAVENVAGTPFLVLEWIPGQTLREYVQNEALTDAVKRSLFQKIVQGVISLHQQSLVHRDLKPDNILVTNNGDPKIVDLGLVRHFENAGEDVAGTYAYMSPEVARKQIDQVGMATDIFGLGGILYFLLTGKPVYAGTSKNDTEKLAKNCEFTNPLEVSPEAPEDLVATCLRCLNEQPKDRFASAAELLEQTRPGPTHRNIAFLVVASSLVLLAAGWLVWAYWPRPEPFDPDRSSTGAGLFADPGAEIRQPPGNDESVLRTDVSAEHFVLQAANDLGTQKALEYATQILAPKPVTVNGENHEFPLNYVRAIELFDLQAQLFLQLGQIDNAIAAQQNRLRACRQMAVKLKDHGFDYAADDVQVIIDQLKEWKKSGRGVSTNIKSALINFFKSRHFAAIGEHGRAINTSRPLVDNLEQQVGKGHFLFVAAIERFCHAKFWSNDRQDLEPWLNRWEEGIRETYDAESREMMLYYTHRVDFELGTRDIAEARRYAELGVTLCSREFGDVSRRAFEARIQRASVAFLENNFQEVVDELHEMLNDFERYDPGQEMIAVGRKVLARAYLQLNKLAEAETQINQAIGQFRPAADKSFATNRQLCFCLAVLGQIQQKQQKYRQSMETLQECMSRLTDFDKTLPEFLQVTLILGDVRLAYVKTLDADSPETELLLLSQKSLLNEMTSILKRSTPLQSPANTDLQQKLDDQLRRIDTFLAE